MCNPKCTKIDIAYKFTRLHDETIVINSINCNLFFINVNMMRLRKYPLRPVISKLHYGTSVSGKRPLQSNDIRRDFLDYFVTENGHKYVKSSPVVPFCDPTVPFVNAGMVQVSFQLEMLTKAIC